MAHVDHSECMYERKDDENVQEGQIGYLCDVHAIDPKQKERDQRRAQGIQWTRGKQTSKIHRVPHWKSAWAQWWAAMASILTDLASALKRRRGDAFRV